jgi:hypothetical protein
LTGVNVRAAALVRATGERLLDLGVAGMLLGGLLLPLAVARAQTGDPVLLNEMLVHHTGDDTTEFVELFGTPGMSLAGLSLVVVEGDNSAAGTIDLRLDFGADDRLGGNGFFLVGNPVGLAAHYGVVPDLAVNTTQANGFMENGSQTVALVATAGLGAVEALVSGGEDVRDALAFHDGGLTETFFWGAPVADLDDGFLPAGAHRVGDGLDTDASADWALADFNLGPANTPTPATPFDEFPVATCQPTLEATAGTAASAPVSATDPDGVVTSFVLTVTPDPGTVTLGSVSPAGTTGAAATATVDVGAATPPGSYQVSVTALTASSPPQEAGCDVAVTVDAAPLPPPPDPADEPSVSALVELLDALVAGGSVDDGKADALMGHLERAAHFLEAGKTAAADAQLRAFANQAQGFVPRWLDSAAADQLEDGVAALRAQLGG